MSCWKSLGALLAAAPLVGCAYANISMPLDTDLDRTELGSKVGRASIHSVLGMVAWGDAGTQAAARNGGLQVLTHADQEVLVILGVVYARRTTVVYGD